jgi:hypothetical protein
MPNAMTAPGQVRFFQKKALGEFYLSRINAPSARTFRQLQVDIFAGRASPSA